jgi:hypothetical protein
MVDAVGGLEVTIKPRDVKGAVSRNPEQCVVARAIGRALADGVKGVKIGAHVAYVEFDDHVERYVISEETRAMIKAYDKLDYYPAGVVARLLQPSPARALGAATKRPAGKKTNERTGNAGVRSTKSSWLRHVDQPTSD